MLCVLAKVTTSARVWAIFALSVSLALFPVKKIVRLELGILYCFSVYITLDRRIGLAGLGCELSILSGGLENNKIQVGL